MPFGFVSLAFFLLLHDSKSDTIINMYNTFFILETLLLLCYGSVSLPGMVEYIGILLFQFLSQSRQDFIPYVVLVSVCELRYFVHCPPRGTVFQDVDGHFFGRYFLFQGCIL